MGSQHDQIRTLGDKLDSKTAKLEELEVELARHSERCQDRFQRVQDGLDETRIITNDVEAHGHRWALRILGIPAPESNSKTIMQAKELVLKIIESIRRDILLHW